MSKSAKDAAVRENGKCVRCNERFGGGNACAHCGVGRDTKVSKS